MRNMGLMRHSRTAVRCAVHPPARERTPSHEQEGTHAARMKISLDVQSHFSSSQPFASIRPSNAHKHSTHAQTHFSSSLASTSITLRSSSLRFPSPLAISSFINHDSVLLLCECVSARPCALCGREGERVDVRLVWGWMRVGVYAKPQTAMHKHVWLSQTQSAHDNKLFFSRAKSITIIRRHICCQICERQRAA